MFFLFFLCFFVSLHWKLNYLSYPFSMYPGLGGGGGGGGGGYPKNGYAPQGTSHKPLYPKPNFPFQHLFMNKKLNNVEICLTEYRTGFFNRTASK